MTNEQMSGQVILPLVAASLAAMVAHDRSSTRVSDSLYVSTLVALAPSPSAIKSAGSFLSAIARHCAQVTGSNDGFSFMETIFEHLDGALASAGQKAMDRNVIHNIKAAAAFCLCDDSCQPEKLEWAMKVGQTIGQAQDARFIETPGRATLHYDNGYKWEEGISEWIKRTPVALKPDSASSLGSGNKSNSIVKPLPMTDANQALQLLSNVSSRQEGAGSEPEATITAYGTGQTEMPYDRLETMTNATSDSIELDIESGNVPQVSLPQPRASDVFQMAESGNEQDLDELSTPDESLRHGASQLQCAGLQQQWCRRQRPGRCKTGADQDTKRRRVPPEEEPTWIKKRTSLGLKLKAQDLEDELGSQ